MTGIAMIIDIDGTYNADVSFAFTNRIPMMGRLESMLRTGERRSRPQRLLLGLVQEAQALMVSKGMKGLARTLVSGIDQPRGEVVESMRIGMENGADIFLLTSNQHIDLKKKTDELSGMGIRASAAYREGSSAKAEYIRSLPHGHKMLIEDEPHVVHKSAPYLSDGILSREMYNTFTGKIVGMLRKNVTIFESWKELPGLVRERLGGYSAAQAKSRSMV